MERQHTHSSRLKSIAGTALAVLLFFVLFGNPDWAADRFFCSATGDALGVLPGLVLAGCQVAQAYVLDQQGLMGWLLQTLLSFAPLLSVLWAAM
jgi:hypothetical protein